ncbi:MAG TPA: sensor histidine kinase [Polyangia bacterium]|nr:sensor histidine kinase [Polyangia bacterium]
MLSSLLVVSIGLAGGTAIYQSARNMRRELTTEYQLFAENRAFALRDNFEILEDELKRLAMLPQMDMGDGDSMPEQLALAGAHEHSVLYNTAVLLLDESGLCQRAVPDRPEYRGQSFGDRAWFRAVRNGGAGPVFRGTDDPGVGRTIKIIQPIRRSERFMGALVGVISLGETNLITPTLHETLPPDTDAVLVDETGEIIYPPDRSRAAEGTGWERAVAAAVTGVTGSLSGEANGQEALFAYSPVRAQTPYALVFSWPWRRLTANLIQQAWTLAGILLFGLVLAAIAGLMLSAYLTRPLEALGDGAIRIARGEPVQTVNLPGAARTEEVGALVAAFTQMEASIRQRDQELREAAAHLEQRVESRTRELVVTQQALVEAERFAAMGKTSAAIAHELKNALNGLGMAVELILQDPANHTRVGRLRAQVIDEVARLRDVVDSLLSFSRSPRINRTRADLTPLLFRVREQLADLIIDRGAEVRIEAPDSLPFVCDSHKIQGVLVNLVKNAVDAGHTVRVRAAADGDALTLEVADDGPGLSTEARAHLFEPFFTTKPNGTGLGLPTSRRYVEAHGGSIDFDGASDLGGARVRVRLPREAASPA